MLRFTCSPTWLRRGGHLGACLIAVLLLAAGWIGGHWIAVRTHSLLTLEEQAVARLRQESETREGRRQLLIKLGDANREVDALDACLPDGPDEVPLIARLSELSKAAGLRIKSFRPGRKVERSTIGEMELRLSCEGSYEALCSFLAEIESLPRIYHIDTLDVSPLGGNTSDVAAEFQFHFLFKNPAPPIAPREEVNHAG